MRKKNRKDSEQKIVFSGYTMEEFIELINHDHPIKLIDNIDLIDRVCIRYPYLTKAEISIIIKAVFESFRELVLSGKILDFKHFFHDMKLYLFLRHCKADPENPCPSMKIRISMPSTLSRK